MMTDDLDVFGKDTDELGSFGDFGVPGGERVILCLLAECSVLCFCSGDGHVAGSFGSCHGSARPLHHPCS